MSYYKIDITTLDNRQLTVNVAENEYESWQKAFTEDRPWQVEGKKDFFYLPKCNVFHWTAKFMETKDSDDRMDAGE